MRRSLTCLGWLLITIPSGLLVRYARLHLPWWVSKYVGSMLWSVAVYWLLAALLPRAQVRLLFLFSAGTALLVEFSRLVPEPHVDAFRLTVAGKLLLGRLFSFKNIAAYLAALAVVALFDRRYHPGR